MNNQKIISFLLIAGVAVCMMLIWAPAYFLTGDGPCHLYNAGILHDAWVGKNTAFYSRFFNVVYQPNPNWFATLVMALLLFIANGIVAEKIFLTLYLIFYLGGFYLLLKKVTGARSYWLLVIFAFVFTHALSKGFYNFSFSIAFYFWVAWSWLRFLEKRSIPNALLFFVFALLIFFTHLLAFVIAIMTCAALAVSFSIVLSQNRLRSFLGNVFALVLLVAPMLAIMIWFTNKEGGVAVRLGLHFYRIVELVQFKHFVNFNHSELLWTTIAGSTLSLLLLLCVVRYKDLLKVNKYDGFLLTLVLVGVIYLVSPEDLLGRAMDMSLRMQVFVGVLMAVVLAYRLPAGILGNAGAIILFACFVVLSGLRFNCLYSTSEAGIELMSVDKYINPYSTVLPLNFALGGIGKQGKEIADWNASFRHATQYMGVGKPLIMLDNYEANTGYFPVQWKAGANPYHYLSVNTGIEGIPPFARIGQYKQQTGTTIDYIVMWCYNSSFQSNEDFKTLYSEINTLYHIVYVSLGGRVILYEKNS